MSKRKELKDNELADAITDQFDHIKPHLPKILIGFAAVVAVVFGINFLVSSRSKAKEAKSINLVLFSVENSAAGSLATLDQQIDDYPDDPNTAWAYLLKADRELTSGLDKIFVDRLAGQDFIRRSINNFEKANDVAGESKMIKQRSLFGWARALESLGQFDEAAAKYSELLEDENSPFSELAQKGVERVKDPRNQDFYTAFLERENNTIDSELPTENAPITDNALPPRPDFTYPGEEAVPGIDDGAPTSDESKTDDAKKDNAPPVPPSDILNKETKETQEKENPTQENESKQEKSKESKTPSNSAPETTEGTDKGEKTETKKAEDPKSSEKKKS